MTYGFVEDQEFDGEGERFLVHFDGVPLGAFRGSRSDIEEYVDRRNREAARVRGALTSSDREALCRLGWHRQRLHDGTPLYFRCLPHLWGTAFGFAIGPAPFDWASTKIAGFGPEAGPWFCQACKEEIGA